MTTIYKVAHVSEWPRTFPDTFYSATSGFVNDIEQAEYPLGKWAFPPKGGGPLFAFETKDLAHKWMIRQHASYSLRLFEAEGRYVRRQTTMISVNKFGWQDEIEHIQKTIEDYMLRELELG